MYWKNILNAKLASLSHSYSLLVCAVLIRTCYVTYLVEDDEHIAVQARGGPEPFEVTAWVQIQGLRETDQGVYTCHAQNDLGEAEASATVNLVHNDGL